MPTIEVPQREVLPTTAITDTRRLLPPGLFDEQFAAGRGLAQAVGQAGAVAANEAIRTLQWQSREEKQRGIDDYDVNFAQFKVDKLADGNYSAYGTRFATWHKEFTTERLKQVNHPGAKIAVKQYYDNQEVFNNADVITTAKNTLVKQTRALWPEKRDLFVERELRANTPETLKNAIAERKDYFKKAQETGVWNEEEAELREIEYQEAKGTKILENTVNAIAIEEGWDAAEAWLNDPKNVNELFKEFGVTLADQGKVLNLVQDRAAQSRAEGKAELEQQQLADSQAILDRILKNDLVNIDDFINSTSLLPTGANSKTTWIDRANKRAAAIINNKKIVTDEQVRGELEGMANDIAIGSVTKEQVQLALDQARYTDEKIDDAAYRQVKSLIEREHKSYQSTAISEGVSFGQGQLVSVTKSVLDTLLAAGVTIDIETATKRRELELWNWGQYRKALNDWLSIHPEADADEIYIQSRKMITQYRRPIEDIEKARADFEQRLQTGEPQPSAKVKARFANPVRVIAPDGRRGWSPEEHFKNVLEPLGFKRIGKNADDSKTK